MDPIQRGLLIGLMTYAGATLAWNLAAGHPFASDRVPWWLAVLIISGSFLANLWALHWDRRRARNRSVQPPR